MSNFVLSLIRTWVPVLVGYLVAWGLLPTDMSDEATLALGAVITAGYYLIVRALERRWTWIGWLLGAPTEPSYTKEG